MHCAEALGDVGDDEDDSLYGGGHRQMLEAPRPVEARISWPFCVVLLNVVANIECGWA